MKKMRTLFLLPLLLIAGTVAAREATVQVEAVQSPAWVERGGQQLPLVAGQALKNRDRIVTGADSRALLRLSDGSAVKLGENASMRVDALGEREPGMFTAAFDVARGAFRFTTGVFNRVHNRRAVNVRIATLTAGIRGTDLWGSADAERDLVCLIEGRITVTHADAEPAWLSEPLSFYVAPNGLPPQPVIAATPAQLAMWAQQTEMQPGNGSLRKNGRWRVSLGVVNSEAEALALYDRVRAAGYPVRIQPLRLQAADAGYRYALSVPQLAGQADAEALTARLRREFGVEAPVAGP
jgi:hypothetical protein